MELVIASRMCSVDAVSIDCTRFELNVTAQVKSKSEKKKAHAASPMIVHHPALVGYQRD